MLYCLRYSCLYFTARYLEVPDIRRRPEHRQISAVRYIPLKDPVPL